MRYDVLLALTIVASTTGPAAHSAEDERIDAEEFVARVLVQIPEPRRHLVRYYGAYSNRARGQRRKAEAQLGPHGLIRPAEKVRDDRARHRTEHTADLVPPRVFVSCHR